MIQRIACMFLGLLLTAPALLAGPPPAAVTPTAPGITLEQIMANPDWIGNPPERAYWGYDSRTLYYWQKRNGGQLRDLYAVNVTNDVLRKVPDSELGSVSARGGDFNLARTLKVFVRDNNVFVRTLASGGLRQVTRDTAPKSDAAFLADGRHVQWHAGNDIYLYDLHSGLIALAADIRLQDDPAQTKAPQNYLQAEQPRLFDFLSRQQANKTAAREQLAAQTNADSTHVPAPWYLGDKLSIAGSSLSPDGRWLVLVTEPKDYQKGASGMMPNYITESGYAEILKRHTYVGLNPPAPQSVLVLDLKTHSSFPLDLSQLPGIKDDPLADLRKPAVEWDVKHGIDRKLAEESVKAPTIRPVSVWDLEWSDNGSQVALEFRANDNKDRWIASARL